MAIDEVTPIRPGVRAKAPLDLLPAIEEQAAKAWQLRNLIQCVREVLGAATSPIEDSDAAMDGLVEFADEICMALQPDTLTRRAAELAGDKERRAEIDAARGEAS